MWENISKCIWTKDNAIHSRSVGCANLSLGAKWRNTAYACSRYIKNLITVRVQLVFVWEIYLTDRKPSIRKKKSSVVPWKSIESLLQLYSSGYLQINSFQYLLLHNFLLIMKENYSFFRYTFNSFPKKSQKHFMSRLSGFNFHPFFVEFHFFPLN